MSCDEDGAIESTVPTSLEKPIYEIDGVVHYAVDHTPTIFYRSASSAISHETSKYMDALVENRPNEVLESALIIKEGCILDERINRFQGRPLIDASKQFESPDTASLI